MGAQYDGESIARLGYEVIAPSGPQQALDGLGAIGQLDLLFTDVVMPGMNGRALAERMRELRPAV